MDNLEPRCYPEEGGRSERLKHEKDLDHEPQNIGYRIHRLPLEAENNPSLTTSKEMGPQSDNHMEPNSGNT